MPTKDWLAMVAIIATMLASFAFIWNDAQAKYTAHRAWYVTTHNGPVCE